MRLLFFFPFIFLFDKSFECVIYFQSRTSNKWNEHSHILRNGGNMNVIDFAPATHPILVKQQRK